MSSLISFAIVFLLAAKCPDGGAAESLSAPMIKTHNNLTEYGYFRQVSGSNENWRLYSAWLQDDLNKRLMVSVGKRGEPDFQADYIFMANQTFEIYPKKGGAVGEYGCTNFPDFNYDMEVDNYGYPAMGYVGQHTLHKSKGIKTNVWAGEALDGVGPLQVVMYVLAEEPQAFLGLVILGSLQSNVSYSEYWYGDNFTNVAPPASTYTLPPACDTPKVEYYFHIFDQTGQRLPSSSLVAMASNSTREERGAADETDELNTN